MKRFFGCEYRGRVPTDSRTHNLIGTFALCERSMCDSAYRSLIVPLRER